MTLADGAFSAEQAARGSEVFRNVCSECHDASEFRGTDFMFDWEGSTVGRFVRLVSETMPDDNPGSVPIEQVVAVAAYVLELNDYPAGASELTTDLDQLSMLRFERPRLDLVIPAGPRR
jgi:mono/diheme cytochrome c family protein